jgi:hypothetical protein
MQLLNIIRNLVATASESFQYFQVSFVKLITFLLGNLLLIYELFLKFLHHEFIGGRCCMFSDSYRHKSNSVLDFYQAGKE